MYQKYMLMLSIVIAGISPTFCQAQDSKVGRVRAYNRDAIPTPPGMAYMPGGSILIKYNNLDNDSAGYKQVSLTPFFIDKTEVTNRQYREFVNWVIDSIAITTYLKDDKYFTSANRDSSAKYIDWSKINKPVWKSKDADIQGKIQPMYAQGDIRRELVNYSYIRTKTMADGRQEYITERVNVYPDTRVWATDFPNSQTEMMVQAYFSNEAYDDYPVVGVTWRQAQAYAHWRTNMSSYGKNAGKYMMGYKLPYSLPSEAQWAYAAMGEITYKNIDSFRVPRDNKGRLKANFKQSEGDYTQDGSSYTMHAKSYSPNEFGLHNMFGNVAEWVLDAYNESAWAFVHDQNPVLLYDADESEPGIMKRKVVRGGSWKDNAQSLSPYTREYEIQDVPHSYIGFRCVMPAPEVLTKKVESRR